MRGAKSTLTKAQSGLVELRSHVSPATRHVQLGLLLIAEGRIESANSARRDAQARRAMAREGTRNVRSHTQPS